MDLLTQSSCSSQTYVYSKARAQSGIHVDSTGETRDGDIEGGKSTTLSLDKLISGPHMDHKSPILLEGI
uniref:Uncharacterized protein n=1 Tax=Bracon brevicornis TaxID=1563983 RepID=A0A6V7HYD9_9HYME